VTDIFELVSEDHARSRRSQALQLAGLLDVRAAHFEPSGEQQAGHPIHAGSADPDQVEPAPAGGIDRRALVRLVALHCSAPRAATGPSSGMLTGELGARPAAPSTTATTRSA